MPFDSIFRLQLNFATLMVETQTVMALRLMAMSGLIPAHQGENMRMWQEKGPAMMKSFAAGNKAMMSGGRPDQILNAAMHPVRQKVTSNRKRLTK